MKKENAIEILNIIDENWDSLDYDSYFLNKRYLKRTNESCGILDFFIISFFVFFFVFFILKLNFYPSLMYSIVISFFSNLLYITFTDNPYQTNILNLILFKRKKNYRMVKNEIKTKFKANKDLIKIAKYINPNCTLSNFYKSIKKSNDPIFIKEYSIIITRRLVKKLNNDFTEDEVLEIYSSFLFEREKTDFTDYIRDVLLSLVKEKEKNKNDKIIYSKYSNKGEEKNLQIINSENFIYLKNL